MQSFMKNLIAIRNLFAKKNAITFKKSDIHSFKNLKTQIFFFKIRYT